MLIVGGVLRRETADAAVARLVEIDAERAALPGAAEPEVVPGLAAFEPILLDMIEQHGRERGELGRGRDRTGDPRASVVVGGAEAKVARVRQANAIRRRGVDAVRPRIDRIGEEPRAVRAEGREQGGDRRRREVPRQHDPVVDGNAIVVDGQIEVLRGRDDDTGAGVSRGLGLQR